MRQKFFGTALIALSSLVVLTSCGKVSQDVGIDDSKKPKIFILKTYVQVTTTSDYKVATLQNPAMLNQFVFTPQTKDVYVAVMRKNGATFSQLSWGRATLLPDTTPVSGMFAALSPTANAKPKFKSMSYDKTDFELQAADVAKTRVAFEPTKFRWESESRSLPADLDTYWVAYFDARGNYALRAIDQKTVSGNDTVSLGEITPYETFVSIMLLTQQVSTANRFDKPVTRQTVIDLFSPLFFEAINYAYPPNLVDNFNPKEPQFKFNRKLENDFLAILALYVTDKKEALNYLETHKQTLPMSEGAYNILRLNITRAITTPATAGP